jgi:uncharacterized phage protein (TIGR01671 family)
MREIKFRAWDKKAKEMLTLQPNWSISVLTDKKYYAIMQFTGLKDKNGIEIYEGDMVQTLPDIYLSDGYKAEVRWMNCGWWLHAYGEGNIFMNWGTPSGGIEKGLEVIGNIYENPELLHE